MRYIEKSLLTVDSKRYPIWSLVLVYVAANTVCLLAYVASGYQVSFKGFVVIMSITTFSSYIFYVLSHQRLSLFSDILLEENNLIFFKIRQKCKIADIKKIWLRLPYPPHPFPKYYVMFDLLYGKRYKILEDLYSMEDLKTLINRILLLNPNIKVEDQLKHRLKL